MRFERAVSLPAPTTAVWEWQLGARCRNVDLDIFFADDCDPAREQRAKSLCRVCPVIDKCRDYAVAAGEPHGIWGGLSAEERIRLRWQRPPLTTP